VLLSNPPPILYPSPTTPLPRRRGRGRLCFFQCQYYGTEEQPIFIYKYYIYKNNPKRWAKNNRLKYFSLIFLYPLSLYVLLCFPFTEFSSNKKKNPLLCSVFSLFCTFSAWIVFRYVSLSFTHTHTHTFSLFS
jgi:hypothetical protein